MLDYKKPDFQDIYYYAAPKSADDRPKSLDEVDPELLKTYEKAWYFFARTGSAFRGCG